MGLEDERRVVRPVKADGAKAKAVDDIVVFLPFGACDESEEIRGREVGDTLVRGKVGASTVVGRAAAGCHRRLRPADCTAPFRNLDRVDLRELIF
jgi:hypothetical protein